MTKQKLTPLQKAAFALQEMRARLDRVERSRNEPIAIVGMACRFPGGIDSPDAYWSALVDGVDLLSPIPESRWDVDALYHPQPGTPGKMYCKHGYFVRNVDRFDPFPFEISPREARSLDPQQRLLLEVSWEALENAHIPIDRLTHSPTGVFIGIGQNDYARRKLYSGNPKRIEVFDGTGNGFCFASGRVLHTLGLQGPNLSVDSACSSSLTALHYACQSLRSLECDIALTGGVQLMLAPDVGLFLSQAKALSPDGRCKTFDASADGFGRGEGCGVLVLKRLSGAERDGDRILALIRGSAVNHNGPGSGITVPNPQAQQKVIRDAMARAGVDAGQIDFLEAHGTGTELGDPIELRAIHSVFMENRSRPLYVGSVKSNIGHLEAAAGVAGIMKTVLCMRHRSIPQQILFQTPNPHFDWTSTPIRIASNTIDWPSSDDSIYAGVSAFGISGTNVHVVLEGADAAAKLAGSERGLDRGSEVLALSAKSDAALQALAGSYADGLSRGDASWIDICANANQGRSQWPHRLAVTANNSKELIETLRDYTAGQTPKSLRTGTSRTSPRVAFVYTGQGSQLPSMGRALYEHSEVFRAVIDRCDAQLQSQRNASLVDWLYGNEKEYIHQTERAQPALFALEYALTEIWRNWGIEPVAVLGHSVGEYAAACAAGVMPWEGGLRLIAERGRLMQALPQGGGMAALLAPPEQVEQWLSNGVSLAALNGPRNTVISGPVSEVDKILQTADREGVVGRRLDVSHAFHSSLMEPMLQEFETFAQGMIYQKPSISLISNRTGLEHESFHAAYWKDHIREPVRFAESARRLCELEIDAVIELGPHPVLLGMMAQCVEQMPMALPSLKRGSDDWRCTLDGAAQLYVAGASLDWKAIDGPRRHAWADLPTYPFQRKRYWIEDDGRMPHESSQTAPLYELAWKCQPELQTVKSGTGHWLLIGGPEALAQSLKKELTRHGCTSQFVNLEVNADDVLRDTFNLEGVAFLENINAPSNDELTLDRLSSWQERSCGDVLKWLQALLLHDGAENARWWTVTHGACPAGDAPNRVSLAQASCWGLGKTAALEYPQLWGGQIDLPWDDDDGTWAERIVKEWLGKSSEAEIALREDGRYAPRLQPINPAPKNEIDISKDGTYWIVGGLGALGLKTASWLVDRGARNMVLSGRRGLTKEARPQVEQLCERGARVEAWSVDAADGDAMREAARRIQSEMPPLKAIAHTAGSLGIEPIETMSLDTFKTVMNGKTLGAFNLLEIVQNTPLDFVVLFSSIASVWGSKSQSHYSAANFMLDSFAHDAQCQCHKVYSINWGPWLGGGMAQQNYRDQLERMGVASLEADRAMALLEQTLNIGRPQTVAVDAHWRKLYELFQLVGRESIFEDVVDSETEEKTEAAAGDNTIVEALNQTPPEERVPFLKKEIQSIVADILDYDAGSLPDSETGFFTLGMDSLLAVELKDRLVRMLNIDLQVSAVFNYPTASDLAAYIVNDRIMPSNTSTTDEEQHTTQPIESDTSEPESLETMVAQKFSRLENLLQQTKESDEVEW